MTYIYTLHPIRIDVDKKVISDLLVNGSKMTKGETSSKFQDNKKALALDQMRYDNVKKIMGKEVVFICDERISLMTNHL